MGKCRKCEGKTTRRRAGQFFCQHCGMQPGAAGYDRGGGIMPYKRKAPEMTEEQMQAIIANSYRNFHAKGLDYICLERTENVTLKIYFLDGDVSKIPEVVNPHDHRYPFGTTVLAGAMADHRFVRDDAGEVFTAFDYMTPLNGGDGFTFRGEERLRLEDTTQLAKHGRLRTSAEHVHTIQMLQDQTILCLVQHPDTVPLEKPTSTWVRSGSPAPDTSGLYDRFTEDQVIDRLRTLHELGFAAYPGVFA